MTLTPYRTREELREIAVGLRENRRIPLYGEAEAGLLLARALLARIGGPEELLSDLLGPARAKAILAPAKWRNGFSNPIRDPRGCR